MYEKPEPVATHPRPSAAGGGYDGVPPLATGTGWRVPRAWSQGGGSPPPARSLGDLFTAQATRAPEATAIVTAGGAWTYGELATRAGRLAHRLRRLGVGAEVPVGLCLRRSPELIVALLAVVRCGGVYLPLDPDYPRRRLAFMVEDAGARVLVAAPDTEARLPAAPAAARLVLGTGDRAAAPETAERPQRRAGLPAVDPDQLAYIIYTSGSTGRPKGVAVTHRNVARLVCQAGFARFGPGETFLLAAPISFDASTLEIWGPLASGGRLALLPPGRVTIDALAEAIRRHRVTTLWLTAGLFHQMVDARLDALRGLGRLLAGGDVLAPASVERVLRELPATVLVNGYGPTENTTFTCCHAMRGPDDAPGGRSVPIGRPIAGTAIHLLDAALRPVAPGEPGELYAGGAGVARGYLGRPALTAERFVPDPSGGARPGARLYRTGDLARWRPDGVVEFLGRRDQQVKVNGVRVEPEEVEAALGALAEVAACAVVPQPDPAGGKRLVAYVVSRGERSAGPFRRRLAERLPEALVPRRFVFLDDLPLGPNGKLDRAALPAPEAGRPDLGQPPAPPRGRRERTLAAAWSDLFGFEVGRDDDFFALGGHSLLAGRLTARLTSTLGAAVPLTALYEHPTVAALAAWLEAGGGDEPAPPPLVPQPHRRPAPLTFPQERVWFLHRLAPDSRAYNFQATVRLRGGLAVGVLAAALSEIVRRHEVLRTRFADRGAGPVQEVLPPWPVRLGVVDLGALPPARREAVAESLLAAEVAHRFDPRRPPLVRWRLLRLAAGEHLLIQVEHHLVHDGWSFALLLHELEALYRAFATGRSSPLPPPPAQCSDLALWQRDRMRGEVLNRHLAYWQETLAGAPPPVELPADRPRPRVQSFRGAAPRLELPPALCRELRRFARRQGVTLFATMLAGFAGLLARYSGERDLVFSTSAANRRPRKAEGVLGMVVNTLPLRLDLVSSPGLAAAARRAQRAVVAAFAHEGTPFDKLVERLAPARDPSRTPLYQVSFSFHDSPVPDLRFAGLVGEVVERANGSAKGDLGVVAIPRAEQRVGRAPAAGEDRITLLWEYSTDLFDATTMRRMAGHYRRLLAAAVAEPATALERLPLMTAAERHQLLAEWSGAAAPAPPPAAIHERIAARARLAPDAVAVAGPAGRQLSFGALDAGARRLARRLRRLGVGPEVAVGVCCRSSPEAVVAVLGVLHAGGAYLPLDPEHPRRRLELMLDDTGAPVVLADAAGAAALGDLDGGRRLLALAAGRPPAGGGGAAAPGGSAAGPPPPGGGAERLAYVIYTSGSAGAPKPVGVSHRALGAHLAALSADLAPVAADRCLQFSALSFDVSIEQLLAPLAAGAPVVLRGDEAWGVTELASAVGRHGLTAIDLPTSFWQEWALAAGEGGPAGSPARRPDAGALRRISVGGEAMSAAAAARWHRSPLGGVPLVNAYGPTEATVTAVAGTVPPGAATAGGGVPIGRPLAGRRVYSLGRDGRPAAIGVPGELAIGGPLLARGYLGRPRFTAERFLPDPFAPADEAGGRLFRTGDGARFRADGTLEILGRLDDQLKVRGYRVEPGEIEALLAAHPAVTRAAVVAAAGGQRLAAFVVTTGAAPPAATELRALLRRRLPEYMVPATFVPLPELPRTASGKVDRRALAARAAAAAAADGASAPPRTPLERTVAAVWSEVLGLGARPIGIDESFFDLGGHSLLAGRALAKLSAAAGVELPFAAFFERPTVAGVARAVEAALAGGREEEDEPLAAAAGAAASAPPLSFAQERMWFLERLRPGTAVYHMSRLFRLRGPLDVPALTRTFGEILRRQRALRTGFPAAAGRPRARVAAGLRWRLPVVDLGALPPAAAEERARRLAARLAGRPFDLDRGPLLRAALVRRAPDQHLLLVVVHHIVSDGASLEVLYRELEAGYAAFAGAVSAGAGETPPAPPALPPLPVQYGDFAAWQRRRLRGERLRRLLAYWRRALAGAPAELALPADRPRPAAPSFRGGLRRRRLDAAAGRALTETARAAGVTPFVVALAVFAALLGRWAGCREAVVGVDASQRSRSELDGLIGLFVNQLVLRVDLAGTPTLGKVLRRANAAALGAFAHQELPFGELVDALRPPREPGRNPLFQVMLVYLEAAAEVPRLAGLTVEREPLAVASAPFDLTLFVAPGPGAGLDLDLRYATDLFTAATADRLLHGFERLLAAFAATPGRRLDDLDPLPDAATEETTVSTDDAQRASLDRLLAARPREVGDGSELIRSRPLGSGRLPLLVTPVTDGVDLGAWGAAHRGWIDRRLATAGGILFRGFGVTTAGRFNALAEALFGELIEYGERSSPRSRVDGRVYTSTDHPADQRIHLHNEQSYTLEWPLKICFCCLQPAAEGGATPIADSRGVLARLDAELVERFERRRVLYVRNYGSGLGLPWQEAFQTADRGEVEAHCRRAAIDFEWLDGERLRTRQVRPAVRRHPVSGERTWFNHALFFHLSSLAEPVRASLLASLAEDELPTNTYYGDGSPIDDGTLAVLREAYRAETLSFPWQRGDVLLLDNMLTCHGRDPFSGERRVVVAMAEPVRAMTLGGEGTA